MYIDTLIEQPTEEVQAIIDSLPKVLGIESKEGVVPTRIFMLNREGVNDYAVTSNEADGIDAITWVDKKPVNILTTCVGGGSCVVWRQRIGGNGNRFLIRKGNAHQQYSKHMGSVDCFDQNNSSCDINHRNFTWRRTRFLASVRYWTSNSWTAHGLHHRIKQPQDRFLRAVVSAKYQHKVQMKAERKRLKHNLKMRKWRANRKK